MPLVRSKTTPKDAQVTVVSSVRTNSLEDLNLAIGGGGGFGGLTPLWGDPVRQPWTLAQNSPALLLSLDWVTLSEAYKSQGIVQTVIDQPVEDALRGGFEIVTNELSADELKALYAKIGCLAAAEELNNLPVGAMQGGLAVSGVDMGETDLQSVKDTRKWARLFGGSGLIVNTNQDFSKPLDVESITEDSPLQFIAADRWEFVVTLMQLYEPKIECPYTYYGLPLNRTRVIRCMGVRAPAFVRRQLQGWGMSELERCLSALNQYDRMESLVFDLLKEAKVDVFKIAGFNDMLATSQGMALIMRRIQLAQAGKGYQTGLSMDTEDDFAQKTIPFSGIADIWEQVRKNCAAATRFPINKLFGESATGFGGGEDSAENYNSIVEIERECIRPMLTEVIRLRSQQMYGFQPEFVIKFRPLKILNGLENEQVKTSEQARILGLREQDLVDGQEASELLVASGLLPIDTAVLRGEREPEPMGQSAFNDDPAGLAVAGAKGKSSGGAKRGLAAASPATRAAVSRRGGKGKAEATRQRRAE